MADEGKSYNGQCGASGRETPRRVGVGGSGLGRSPGAGGREEPCVRGQRWPRGQEVRGAAEPEGSRVTRILALEDL